MSDIVLSKISTLLQAKAHESNPMSRGAFVKELVDALNIPVSTINLALSNEMNAAKWGIYKMTPNKQRNILWGYSKDIADKTNALPFDVNSLTGIDPVVQAAEVSKLVTACPEPIAHEKYKAVLGNMDTFRQMLGLSEDDWPNSELFGRIFDVAAAHWNEHFKTNKIGDNDDSE